jgi:hypothetical protein
MIDTRARCFACVHSCRLGGTRQAGVDPRRAARHTLRASSTPVAAGRIQHQTDELLRLRMAVSGSAARTPAAIVQSSPTRKSYQNSANDRSLFFMGTLAEQKTVV